MRTAAKLTGAFAIFSSVVLLFLSRHETSRSVPLRLKPLAKFYHDSIAPERFRAFASNVLAEPATNGQSRWIGKTVPDFPAPANAWIVAGSTNSIVTLVSLGGFSSYTLTIGPEWFAPGDIRAEKIASGIYLNER
jgi:hypothetical protein